MHPCTTTLLAVDDRGALGGADGVGVWVGEAAGVGVCGACAESAALRTVASAVIVNTLLMQILLCESHRYAEEQVRRHYRSRHEELFDCAQAGRPGERVEERTSCVIAARPGATACRSRRSSGRYRPS